MTRLVPKVYALSVRQPWADQIVRGRKRNEFRSRRTLMRGSLLIHASLHRESGSTDDLPRGCLVGIARIVACRYQREATRWAWRMDEVLPFRKPVPAKGAVGLFVLPRTVVSKLPSTIRARLHRDPLHL